MPYHKAQLEQMFLTRRDLLCRCGMGMGALGFTSLMGQLGLLNQTVEASAYNNPTTPKTSPLPAKAKRVIHLFMNGGPSQVDTFDPKPLLDKYHGQLEPVPEEYRKTESKTGALMRSPFQFRKYGQSGIEVSELFPRVAECIDDITVIRSMHTDIPNHERGLLLMNTGETRLIRPSVGSWVTYGLGTENQNLPGFMALCPGGLPVQGVQNWQCGFLPGIYQGTYVDTQHTDVEKLIENIRNDFVSFKRQRQQLDLLQELNELHQRRRQQDAQLEARLQSFELAYRMQMDASDAFDISKEPQHVREMYGPGVQARTILIARRLLERGVRFVQVWHGGFQPWDSHENLELNHRKLAKESDQPIAALLKDLKQRGMLEDTLVIWGGEFGRTPTVQLATDGLFGKNNGRDHNHWGFTMWMAGGGVKGGHIHGATDEFGFAAIRDKVHVHDLHATILRLLGFDHEKFTYRYAGRDFRLTDIHGRAVEELIA